MRLLASIVVFASLFGALATGSPTARAAPPNIDQCLAANDKAQDLRREGRLHEARENLILCIAPSCPGPVREDCAQRMSDVEAAMPSLIFDVQDGGGHDMSAVKVTLDERVVADHLDGSATPIDPGSHTLVVEGGGFSHSETLVVHEGDKRRHVHLVLGELTPPPAEDTSIATAAPTPSTTPSVVSFVIGGSGLLAGSIFSGLALHEKSLANAACGTSANQCPGNADSFNSTIRTDTALAVVGFGLAAAGAVVGWLWLPHGMASGPQSGVQLAPVLAPGYGGLAGRF